MNFEEKSYIDVLTFKRTVFKRIYCLPDELVNIIKDFLVKKEWNYNVFMIKKHLKYENEKINIQPFSDVIKCKNRVYSKNIFEYNMKYDKDIDKHKTKKLSRKEYLLSKIKKKQKYKPKYKQKDKNYYKKIELISDFLRKNTCLKCQTSETCEEPFVDFCAECRDYYIGYGYENYCTNSWNKYDDIYNYYSEDNECPCCVRDYRCCRYNFY